MMSCDHAPARASLLVFRESTMFVGFEVRGEKGDEIALVGQCRRCKDRVAIEIDVRRGSVVHGEIGAQPSEPIVEPVTPKLCTLNSWCGDEDGHPGACLCPF